MLNVIEFRKRASRSVELRTRRSATATKADIAELGSGIAGLRSQASREIGNAVPMLDLAAQHGREIAARILNPAAKKDFDEHISTIERLIQLAREMAFKL